MNGGGGCTTAADCVVLKAAIEYMLLNYQFNDAVFLAERLYDNDKTASSGFVLATCYYQSGRVQQARFLSSHFVNESPRCLLLFARCSLDLKLYQEGLTQLQGLVGSLGDYSALKDKFGDDVGVAFSLLGDLNRKLNFIDEASRMYRLALQSNPFMWSAFDSLCQLGKADQSVEEYFACSSMPSFLSPKKNAQGSLDDRIRSCGSVKLPPPTTQEPACPELFKTGLSSASTPASTIPGAPVRGGGAGGGRPPLLSFDNSKGLGSFSLSDSPQAILDFSSSTPATTVATTAHFSLKSERARTVNSSSVVRQSVFSSASSPSVVRPLEMPDLVTPIQQNLEESVLNTPLCNLITPSPYQEQSTPEYQEPTEVLNAPPRSANPRRSARLGGGGIGKSPSSMSISRHRPEMIPSPLTQSRSKARLKSVKSPRLKKRVKFVGNSSQKPHPLSPTKPQENEDPRFQRDGDEYMKLEEEKMDIMSVATAREEAIEDGEIFKSVGNILSILASFGAAYKSLLYYRLQEAVSGFLSLPDPYRNSCWVLSQLGRAMLVKEKFNEAARYYKRVHLVDPHRQEGMDLYGAALWHLQKENDLATLVEDLQSSDKTRPEGLCAASSLMNLYKEHDAAILYLERAVQVSPQHVYAQTLLGLEHILIKDYDKAFAAFQCATSINPRHFNAWYGMGHLFLKQEKWAMAEIFSRRAMKINPTSSVVCTQLALILQQQGKLKQALITVDHAISLNPSNNLPKYHRALILESLEQYEEALKQLQDLTASLPREPLFYKIMSRILMKVGKPHEAVVHMSWSLDYAHSARCTVGGGGVVMMDRGDLSEMIETLPGLNDDDFVVHSDDGNFDS